MALRFMRAYKHLDNICKDMNGIGITGYINDMENNYNSGYRVPGWDDDYKLLKYYRRVRNQIVHENDADEETLCEPGDAEWLDEFGKRIIKLKDPLTLARKRKKPPYSHGLNNKQPYSYTNPVRLNSVRDKSVPYKASKRRRRKNKFEWVIWIAIALAVFAFVFSLKQ